MEKNKILLGFVIGTGKRVDIECSHMIVTGLTGKAGKTTTLESLIMRSKRRAIVFRTKIGEKSFMQGTVIPPFFRDRSDWQFIQGLVESTIKEKMRTFERAKIIQLCKQTGGNSLLDFKKKVDNRLLEKMSGFEKDILTNLQAYLEIVVPKLQSIAFSNELELVEGLNIIDLERFSRDSEVQSIIISSVLEEVLYKFKDVIVVIPEAWKFMPQERGSPCKLSVEEFIRQGATNGNYLWLDSQDMTGVDKIPLKQISEWLLGYQSEKNEVKHTLDQIPLPKGQKPNADDIMSLGTGIFYSATRERTIKVYVQPFWLDEERAKKVAKGEIKIDDLDMPQNLTPFKIAVKKESASLQPMMDFQETAKRFNKELTGMSSDFFNKIGDIQEQINLIQQQVYEIKSRPEPFLDEDAIVRKVMQKMPVGAVSEQAIMQKIMPLLQKRAGGAIYEVSPLEKLKKDFLEEAKQRILNSIAGLDDEQKKMLKYIETQGKGCDITGIMRYCLDLNPTSGSRSRVQKKLAVMAMEGLTRKDKNAVSYPNLKERIAEFTFKFGASEQEIGQVYNHILGELL